MPRFKPQDRTPILLPVDFAAQLQAGTFEHALDHVVDGLNMTAYTTHLQNDSTGAPAYDPRVLLKVILYAYSRGITSSRRIAEACRTNLVFMALAGNQHPDFTTIASFVGRNAGGVTETFGQILRLCARQRLIGFEMFAVDGCKLPSDASREWSGSFVDLANKQRKLEARSKKLMSKHRRTDSVERRRALRQGAQGLNRKADRIDHFLENNEPKPGSRGNEKQSNITDNESAKIKTSRGMIQGYNGIAVVDAKHQIIVEAQAFGTGQEQALLVPMVEGAQARLKRAARRSFRRGVLLADAGYFKESNLEYLARNRFNAYIPDNSYRKRDERFATRSRHAARLVHPLNKAQRGLFVHSDFKYNRSENVYTCPAGKVLRRTSMGKYEADGRFRYAARTADCQACQFKDRCLQSNNQKRRNLYVTRHRGPTFSDRMKDKIDSAEGRDIYSRRMGIVEPVFANITVQKGLSRFSLRGREKVNAQWLLFCLVHNIEKLFRYGGLSGPPG